MTARWEYNKFSSYHQIVRDFEYVVAWEHEDGGIECKVPLVYRDRSMLNRTPIIIETGFGDPLAGAECDEEE